jgi:hypothetical protein
VLDDDDRDRDRDRDLVLVRRRALPRGAALPIASRRLSLSHDAFEDEDEDEDEDLDRELDVVVSDEVVVTPREESG